MDALTFLVLLRLMIRELKPKPAMARFVVPTFRNRKDGTMANPQISLDQIATVPLVFTDATGNQVDPIPGGAVMLDKPLVNATIAADGSSVDFDPAAQVVGTFTATYTNGSISSAPVAFDVVAVAPPGPSPATGVAFDTDNISFRPRETPPASVARPHLSGGPVRR